MRHGVQPPAKAKDIILTEDDEAEEEEVQPAVLKKKKSEKSSLAEEEDLDQQQACSKVNNSSPVLAQKILNVLEEDILSLAGQAEEGLLPPFTIFTMTEQDNMQHLLHEMKRECPTLCRSNQKEQLVFTLLSLLDDDKKEGRKSAGL